MRIGFIWHVPYPPDGRLERIMKAVTEHGHRAVLVCRGTDRLPAREDNGGVRIRRVRAPNLPVLSRCSSLVSYPVFFNPLWIARTLETMREAAVDLIVVRDLPLAFMAAWVGRILGKPVIFDMAENYPAALAAYEKWRYKPFLVANGWLPRKYERVCLQQVDRVLVVVDEQRCRLEALGVDPSKITLVGNTPDRALLGSNGHAVDAHGDRGGAPIDLLYVGFLDPHRGCDVVLRAMPELVQEFPGLKLTLVGDGTSRNKLAAMASSLRLENSVEFTGFVDFSKMTDYINRSLICLIPHRRSEHTDTTMPNKLFEYMALGKPVVAADCQPIKRVIDETDCGLTFKSGDVADFRNSVRALLLDPGRDEKGRRGRKAVEERYNWDVDKRALIHAIHAMREGQPQ